jgi:type I restriction enzyme M protein
VEIEDMRFADPEETNILIEEGDLLLNGTGVGTIGRAAPFLRVSKAIPDNHVTVLRATGIDPVYLSVYLNSRIGQLQVEKFLKGSSGQIELYPSDIAEFLIWRAPVAIQRSIRQAVQVAFDEEHLAASLLEVVKKAVEIAVEQDEGVALRFLKQEGD